MFNSNCSTASVPLVANIDVITAVCIMWEEIYAN